MQYLSKLQGEAKFYYRSGQLQYIANFKDNEYEGLYQRFREDGKKELEATYVKGQLEGKFQRWNEADVLIEESNWKAGKREGTTRIFDNEGKEINATEYANGLALLNDNDTQSP